SEEVVKDLFERRSSIDPSQLFTKPSLQISTQGSCHMETGISSSRYTRSSRCATPFRPQNVVQSSTDLGNYPNHFQMFTLTFMMSIIYDCEARAKDDHVAHAITRYGELIVDGFASAAMMLMETFPFRMFAHAVIAFLQLPSWFPGATFETSQENDVNTTAVKDAASVAFTAATETVSFPWSSFASHGRFALHSNYCHVTCVFLAMVLNPEVHVKAQAEIDRVVGKDRLPNFNDRPALPYLEAVLRETFRWHPVIPLGVPHATVTSDIYNGYFIPKGVVVFPNAWKAPYYPYPSL
ncbi:cytochrome P450, partial [Suillus placidus]